tara:strand:- start:52226 stop:52603 length:378 start_codon:yes stop_codon:yes gene_type:complete
MIVPKNLFYTSDHEWIDINKSMATIGITDFAQSQLGDIIFVEFPAVGEKLLQGSTFGEIEAVKTVSELYAPISGEVISINEDIERNPNFINSDPYGKGWLIKMEIVDNKESFELLKPSEYETKIF